MSNLTVYEIGVRSPLGVYSKIFDSPDKQKAMEHAEIVRVCKGEGFVLVLIEKYYSLTSSTPFILDDDQSEASNECP